MASRKREDLMNARIPDIIEGRINLYPDGSAHKGKGGWGLYCLFPDGKELFFYGRAKNTTISRMEMTALSKALDIVLKYNGEYHMIQDSQFIVNSVNKRWLWNWANEKFINRPNDDLWRPILEKFNQLRREGKVLKYEHMRGHIPKPWHPHVNGNHIADILADYKT